MFELPRIPVNFVNDYTVGRSGNYRFQSDSGIDTRISTACRPYGLGFTLQYHGLKPSEMGLLMRFWRDIGLDSGSGFSLRSFRIPRSHPFWEKVSTWQYIEDYLLVSGDINQSFWIGKRPNTVKVPVINVHGWEFQVEETYE